MPYIPFEADGTGVTFFVYVTARANKSEVAGERDGALWVRLVAPPIGGKANAALVALLGEWLGVAKAHVEIVAGRSVRWKRVRIASMDAATMRARLAGR